MRTVQAASPTSFPNSPSSKHPSSSQATSLHLHSSTMSSFATRSTTVFQQIHTQQVLPLLKQATEQHDAERKPNAIQLAKTMANAATHTQSVLAAQQQPEEKSDKKQHKSMWLRQLVLSESHLGGRR